MKSSDQSLCGLHAPIAAQRLDHLGARLPSHFDGGCEPEVIVIAGMEARGFIFGAAVAAQLELPFIPIRKPGKLPCRVIGVDYELEYGVDRLEMDPQSIAQGQAVAIVDDLLATGGTAAAATELLRNAGGLVTRAAFVIDLPELGGREKLAERSVDVSALMNFAGA